MRVQDRYDALKTCEKMCHAGRAATAYYYREFYKDAEAAELGLFSIGDIQRCHSDLEATYIVRMYTEFEITLRDYWENGMGRTTKPAAEVLMNRVAVRNYMRADVLKNAHAVREYRNSLVHGGSAIALTLGEARGYLCQYFSNLPRQW